MASLVDEVASISTVSGSVRREMDDGRGFTMAGTDHAVPREFRSPSRLTVPVNSSRKMKTNTSRNAAFSTSTSAPDLHLGLEDLDLDLEDTLVAEDSAQYSLSSGKNNGERGEKGSRSRRECLESTAGPGGNLTSYSKAINKGMLDSHMV